MCFTKQIITVFLDKNSNFTDYPKMIEYSIETATKQ